jgi:heme/copper-type cytochrome/quinol oxidase subunit 4
MPLNALQRLTVLLVRFVKQWLAQSVLPALKVQPATLVLQRSLLVLLMPQLLTVVPLLQVQVQALKVQLPLILIVDLATLQVAVQVKLLP